MIANSEKTAIVRRELSAPVRWLVRNEILKKAWTILDYGCGRGGDVARLSAAGYRVWGWDPHWRPYNPDRDFQVVMCTYVLNVLPEWENRIEVLESIRKRIQPGGWSYVSVRNDKRALTGWKQNGTWQGDIDLPAEPMEINARFKLWALTREELGQIVEELTEEPTIQGDV